jgi:hypothetical protein
MTGFFFNAGNAGIVVPEARGSSGWPGMKYPGSPNFFRFPQTWLNPSTWSFIKTVYPSVKMKPAGVFFTKMDAGFTRFVPFSADPFPSGLPVCGHMKNGWKSQGNARESERGDFFLKNTFFKECFLLLEIRIKALKLNMIPLMIVLPHNIW